MIYEKRLMIPRLTPKEIPATVEIEIHPGTLRRVEISFPPGPAGLAHLQIKHWERVLYPANPDSDFSGDDIQLVFVDDYEVIDPPFMFTLIGWNEDDTYPHTVTVRLQIAPFDNQNSAVGYPSYFPVSLPDDYLSG